MDANKICDLGFAYVGSSWFVPYRKPDDQNEMELFKILKGVTMVISILYQREKPEMIAEYCKNLGLRHVHIPDDGPTLKDTAREAYEYLINNQERALVHCSAGLHRTGMVTYSFLRWSGLGEKEAYETIKGMREDTHRQVGELRIQHAEKKVVQPGFEMATRSKDKPAEADASKDKSDVDLAELETMLTNRQFLGDTMPSAQDRETYGKIKASKLDIMINPK